MFHPNIPDTVRISTNASPLWHMAMTLHAYSKGELVVLGHRSVVSPIQDSVVMGLKSGVSLVTLTATKDKFYAWSYLSNLGWTAEHTAGSLNAESKNSRYLLRALQDSKKPLGERFKEGLTTSHAGWTTALIAAGTLFVNKYKTPSVYNDTVSLRGDVLFNLLSVYYGRKQALDVPATISNKLSQMDQELQGKFKETTDFANMSAEFFNKPKRICVYRKFFNQEAIITGVLDGAPLHSWIMSRARGAYADFNKDSLQWIDSPELIYGWQNVPADLMGRLTMVRKLRDVVDPPRGCSDSMNHFPMNNVSFMPSINAIAGNVSTGNANMIIMDV